METRRVDERARRTSSKAQQEIPHVPALDGIRGVAVIFVLLYRGGVSWAGGGFLGVDVFFVLSGFLITSLLVAEWQRSGTLRLRRFWARRARRLLPALFCVVAAVGLYQLVAGPADVVPGFAGDGIATLLYYGNWHEILSNNNYFVQSGPLSPLEHTWSLAIEEQFYLVWPLIVLLAVVVSRRGSAATRRRALGALTLGSAIGAVASVLEMALLYDPSNSARVYYGTDTRAQALLAGASLAFACGYFRERGLSVGRLPQPLARWVPPALGALGVVGAGAVLAAAATTHGTTNGLYRFGFLAIDAAVVAVLAAVLIPGSPLGRLLTARPLRATGLVSYGAYLWHLPLFLWLTPSALGVGGSLLLAVRLATVAVVSTVSYFAIEQPIRRGLLPRWLVIPLAPTAAALATAAVLVGANAGVTVVTTTVAPPPAVGAPLPNRLVGERIPRSWAGTAPLCTQLLADTPQYFEAPPTQGQYAADVAQGILNHNNDFGGHREVAFHTCPPARVLFIGDSVAFTIALGMLHDEQSYGVELAVAPLEGCAFNTDGLLYLGGHYASLPAYCSTEYQRWLSAVRSFRPAAVVVEFGWRDSFDWDVGGHVLHLGIPAFDASVQRGMERLVQAFERQHALVLFLSVPWASQAPEPDGSSPPQDSPLRHRLINADLERLVQLYPGEVRVIDIDRYVSPGDHYNGSVDGQVCRYDGLHFTEFCSRLLQPYVLGEVRQLIDDETATPGPVPIEQTPGGLPPRAPVEKYARSVPMP